MLSWTEWPIFHVKLETWVAHFFTCDPCMTHRLQVWCCDHRIDYGLKNAVRPGVVSASDVEQSGWLLSGLLFSGVLFVSPPRHSLQVFHGVELSGLHAGFEFLISLSRCCSLQAVTRFHVFFPLLRLSVCVHQKKMEATWFHFFVVFFVFFFDFFFVGVFFNAAWNIFSYSFIDNSLFPVFFVPVFSIFVYSFIDNSFLCFFIAWSSIFRLSLSLGSTRKSSGLNSSFMAPLSILLYSFKACRVSPVSWIQKGSDQTAPDANVLISSSSRSMVWDMHTGICYEQCFCLWHTSASLTLVMPHVFFGFFPGSWWSACTQAIYWL